MRRHVVGIALACLTIAPRLASGDDPKPFVVGDRADQLAVYRDELGSYYVVPITGAGKDLDTWVFFGDGKKLYQQRIVSSNKESAGGFSWYLWAPRARTLRFAQVQRTTDGKMYVHCQPKDPRELVQVAADQAKALLSRAALLPPLWHRQAHLLARDDDGVYYYVDSSSDDRFADLRVFVGLKGAMKELALSNVLHDSAGELYASKSGSLKIGAGNKDAVWMKDGKKTELTVVDLDHDHYLVYRELGVYGQLGAVCEDQ